MTLTCRTPDNKTVTVRTVQLTQDGEMVTESYFSGKTINVDGVFVYYNGNPQVKLFSLADVEFV